MAQYIRVAICSLIHIRPVESVRRLDRPERPMLLAWLYCAALYFVLQIEMKNIQREKGLKHEAKKQTGFEREREFE